MQLRNLSENLIIIIDRCLQDKKLTKYLTYDVNNPFDKEDVIIKDIAPFGKNQRIFPYQFDVTYKDTQRSQLHIYYPVSTMKSNEVIEETMVWFDIVVHKNLWLVSQDGKKQIRPYIIASCLGRIFENSVSTVGRLQFKGVTHNTVNEEYHCIRIEAKMVDFNG